MKESVHVEHQPLRFGAPIDAGLRLETRFRPWRRNRRGPEARAISHLVRRGDRVFHLRFSPVVSPPPPPGPRLRCDFLLGAFKACVL